MMSRKSFEVDIEPGVLVWARESIGMDVAEIAERLNLSEKMIRKWESGQVRPTIAQIKKLAGVYKRPLAAFFLPEPPEEPLVPNDFRTLPEERRKPLSSQTRLAIRQARRLQSLAIELAKSIESETNISIGRASFSDNPEVVASKVREQIGIDVQTQFTWKKDADAFEEWRTGIERLGVLVFQFPLPVEETRGFSLPGDTFPAIALNERDHIRARIFSLFHEYGHLLLDNSGICNWEDADSLEIGSVEKFCNHFAGAFLVPRSDLLSHKSVESKTTLSDWSDECLGGIARDFRVSREVILRRLVTLGFATWDFYRTKYEKWKEKAKEKQGPKYLLGIGMSYKQYLRKGPVNRTLVNTLRKSGLILTENARFFRKNDRNWEIRDEDRKYLIRDNGTQLEIYVLRRRGRLDMPQKCIRENSIPFVSLVLDSYRKEKITYNDVADYLGIRTKHIPRVENLIKVNI